MEEKQNLKSQLFPLVRAEVLLYNQRQSELEKRMAEMREKLLAFAPKLTGALLMLELPAYRLEPFVSGYWFRHMEAPCCYGWLGAYVERLTSWKQLEPALIALQAAGLELDKWTSYDEARSYTRIFEQRNFFEESVGVRLHATLVGNTDECRRVLVGYESQPARGDIPIYKLECKGDLT